jgi:hypothetical protein
MRNPVFFLVGALALASCSSTDEGGLHAETVASPAAEEESPFVEEPAAAPETAALESASEGGAPPSVERTAEPEGDRDPPEPRLVLRVVDEVTGAPIEGVEANLIELPPEEGEIEETGHVYRASQTDDSGLATWKAGRPSRYRIDLVHPGYRFRRVTLAGLDTPHEVRLQPTEAIVTLDIELVDDRGEPVPDTAVAIQEAICHEERWRCVGRLYPLPLDREGRGTLTLAFPEEGRIVPGDRRGYSVSTRRTGIVTKASAWVAAEPGSHERVRLVLPRMATLRGTVQPRPEPPAVTVHVAHQDEIVILSVNVDWEGRFEFEILPGEFQAAVGTRGGGSNPRHLSVEPGGVVEARFDLGEARPVLEGVVEASGRPVRGIRVEGQFAPLGWRGQGRLDTSRVHTDVDGRFAFFAVEAPVKILVKHPDYVTIERRVGEEREVRLDLVRASTLEIRIVDADGRPVVGTTVAILGPHLIGSLGGGGMPDGRWKCTHRTDSEGMIRLSGLSPAIWEIQSSRFESRDVTIREGVDERLVIQVRER